MAWGRANRGVCRSEGTVTSCDTAGVCDVPRVAVIVSTQVESIVREGCLWMPG